MATALKDYVPVEHPQEDFWSRLGVPEQGPQLYAAIQEGLPYSIYTGLSALLGLERKELAKHAAIPQTTLQRRLKAGKFNTEESDRLYGMAQVVHAAINLFGSEESARRWLSHPVLALGNMRPLEMLGTSVGANSVLTIIGRIEYGVYS